MNKKTRNGAGNRAAKTITPTTKASRKAPERQGNRSESLAASFAGCYDEQMRRGRERRMRLVPMREGETTGAWNQRYTEAVREAWDAKVQEAPKRLVIEVDAFDYGMLCAAGVVHKTTPEDAAAMLINHHLCDWQGEGFYVEGCEHWEAEEKAATA